MTGSPSCFWGDLGGRFVLSSKEMFVYHETATVKLFFFCLGCCILSKFSDY